MITAVHSVVIKKALDVVKGSALHLSWYTNLFSACLLAPIIILAGELPDVMTLLFGPNLSQLGEISTLATFAWGSAITVGSHCSFLRICRIVVHHFLVCRRALSDF